MRSADRKLMEQQLQLAFDAARQAGLDIEKFEVSADGKIAVFCGTSGGDKDQNGKKGTGSALERWLASENEH